MVGCRKATSGCAGKANRTGLAVAAGSTSGATTKAGQHEQRWQISPADLPVSSLSPWSTNTAATAVCRRVEAVAEWTWNTAAKATAIRQISRTSH